MIRLEWWSASEDATLAFGASLGRALVAPAWIGVTGPLGAGKTRFVQGLARGLGVAGRVRSPTFVIENRYQGRVPFRHLDLFRVGAPDLELSSSWDEDSQSIIAVEWAERVDEFPARFLRVELTPIDESRRSLVLEWNRATGVIRDWALEPLLRLPEHS